MMFILKALTCFLSKSLRQLKMLLHSQSNLLPLNKVSRTEHVSTPPPFHFIPIPPPPMAKLMQTSELQCLCGNTFSVLCTLQWGGGPGRGRKRDSNILNGCSRTFRSSFVRAFTITPSFLTPLMFLLSSTHPSKWERGGNSLLHLNPTENAATQ